MFDEKPKENINSAISKVNKGISVTKKLRHTLPEKSLLTIYKVFLRPLIDYSDTIYDQPYNGSFQYKAALTITGAMQGTSCDKIYKELGLESLIARRWYKRLSCMFKIMKEEGPNYFMNLILKCNQTLRARNSHIPIFRCGTVCFKYSFFTSTLIDWFNLDDNIRNSESISVFENRLPLFICAVQNSVFNIFEPKGLKRLTWSRLVFSHLNEHRFQHNFENCVNPLYSCILEADDTLYLRTALLSF